MPKREMADMAILSRDQILQAQDLKTEEVHIPQWNGSVLVRGLTGTERDAFEDAVTERTGDDTEVNMRNIRAKLIALSVVDEQGKRLFTESDVDALGQKSASALNRIFSVAQKLSGLTSKDVDELTKN